MATPAYDIGDTRRLTATFTNLAGAATDPTTVTFKVKVPDGTITTYIYGTHAELAKSATGVYYVDYSITQAGRYSYRFEGTGTVATAENGEFYARRNEAVA